MKLTYEGVYNHRQEWEQAGFHLPCFDREKAMQATREHPQWIHFGAGNIFRAFQANVAQELLNAGVLESGLIAAEGYDYEIIDKMYAPHDNLGILATLKADGSVDKTVVGSIMEALRVDETYGADMARLREIFRSPSLQMASFTITEKGYSLTNAAGAELPAVERDMTNGPAHPVSYIGKVASLLYERFRAGALPVAMVSMDNCSHNGDKLYTAVHAFAKQWESGGLADMGFLAYVEDGTRVSFPWTMIDKITPRPDATVEKMLREAGVEETGAVITSRNTYAAPFVNAEECQYLVVEDSFPNGRPRLEQGGILFTDKETVERVEKMKVCTCLNPLHTALAVFGCLLGYTRISEEMKNPSLRRLVERIGYEEGLPVVTDPGVINPKQFIDEVVNVRIPNPFMPDSPQRIATDTSQKLAIRYGETIKAYQRSPQLDVRDLKMIPLVFAGWVRYLCGVDDKGKSFELSSDPLLDSLRAQLGGLQLGAADVHAYVAPILANERIFGVDLYAAGMGEIVEQYLVELLDGVGAVERTLAKYA